MRRHGPHDSNQLGSQQYVSRGSVATSELAKAAMYRKNLPTEQQTNSLGGGGSRVTQLSQKFSQGSAGQSRPY